MSDTELYDSLSESDNTYAWLVQVLNENPQLFQLLAIMSVVMMVISFAICFFIAKNYGVSKKFTLLGFLGFTGVIMLICYVMAKRAGLSGYFIYLGLFGIYGLIAMFVIVRLMPHNPGEKAEQKKDTAEPYMSEWQKEYDRMRGMTEEDKTQETQEDSGSICLNCGAAVGPGVKICPHCGEKIR